MLLDHKEKPALLYADMLWKIADQSLCQLFRISKNPKKYKTIAPKEIIEAAVIAMIVESY